MSRSLAKTGTANFFELYSRGEALPDEIDGFIERWHEGADPRAKALPLHNYLGLSLDEYELWVQDPDVLPAILAAHRQALSLPEAVNHYIDAHATRPDGEDGAAIRALKAWLAKRETP